MTVVDPQMSPFLHPGTTSSSSSLAILHLRRDQLLPTFLKDVETDNSDYAEGPVTNTRFGSFPHSTLIDVPWGSQVVASQVDTGSRGRRDARAASKRQRADIDDEGRGRQSDKRTKLEVTEEREGEATPATELAKGEEKNDEFINNEASTKQEGGHASIESKQKGQLSPKKRKTASAATSGFCHILPPTPEAWTISLPHRTQVVYTPDYSYILQKMQVRPGSVILEAGAGSGSFTHAAARAVYTGYSTVAEADSENSIIEASAPTKPPSHRRYGRVYSYEYHEKRASQLHSEISSHGLSSLVTITNRDVYNSGFLLDSEAVQASESQSTSIQDSTQTPLSTSTSPNATHVFLDLPAPWEALPHLTRTSPTPLNPAYPVHISIFLPCIEQVQRAVTALRTHGWVEISMQELSQRRIDVRRERVGLDLQGLRGVNASPANVDEACARLREVEKHGRRYLNRINQASASASASSGQIDGAGIEAEGGEATHSTGKKENKAERLSRISKEASENESAFRQGRLTTRTEPEIRTHTSYLVFAVLPREWSIEHEEVARRRWPHSKQHSSREKGGNNVGDGAVK